MWRLGARWGVLGRAAVEQGALAATAMPFLAALGKASGENVYLRIRDGLESETIAIYQADPGLRVYSEVGKRQPLHAGSSRMLLAHAPEAVQTQVLAQRLPRFTPATRTDAAWIAADLQRIRARGYLLTTDEVVAGAAPSPRRCAMRPARSWRSCRSARPPCGCARPARAPCCRWCWTPPRSCPAPWAPPAPIRWGPPGRPPARELAHGRRGA